jgi:metallo-beta-lactamase class B
MRKPMWPVIALTLFPLTAFSQPKGWNDPFPPHRVMDNVYYVGTSQLSSFLVTTPEGHILVSSNYETSVPVIRAAVKELGFEFKDIKILISGHAHPDHVEGDAHPIDRMIDDGDKVTLGGTTLTAHLMPGHTKGCLAWSMDLKESGKTYQALIECSLNGQFLQYMGNKDYPEIAEDMRATYKKARALPVEVFLSSHTIFYGLDQKYAKLKTRGEGDPNPFVDPKGYQAHVDEFEKIFETTLARQRAQAEGKGK